MSMQARQAYLETEIFQAEPLQLVRMLYRAALEAVGQAREHLREGRIAERSRQVSKVSEILIELGTSLEMDKGGELARNLALLYDYMQVRLQAGNFEQQDAPLAEVEQVLTTLCEAWDGCALPVVAPQATRYPTPEPSWEPGDRMSTFSCAG